METYAQSTLTDSRARTLATQAEAAMRARSYADANALFQQALTFEPKSAYLQDRLGAAQRAVDKYGPGLTPDSESDVDLIAPDRAAQPRESRRTTGAWSVPVVADARRRPGCRTCRARRTRPRGSAASAAARYVWRHWRDVVAARVHQLTLKSIT